MRPVVKKSLTFLWVFIAAWITLRYLLPLWSPFLLGLGVALLAEPGVAFMTQRLRMPRAAAAAVGVTGAVTGICLLVLMGCSFLFRELGSLSGILPDLELTARSGIRMLQSWLLDLAGHSPQSLQPMLETNVNELFSGGTALLSRVSSYILGLAGHMLSHVPDSALTTGTAVLAAYMTSVRLPHIRRWVREHLPLERLKPLLDALKRVQEAAGLWLISQMKLALVTFLMLMSGFLLLRVRYAPFLAFLVSLVDAFPVFGTGTVLLPWGLVCFLQQDNARAVGLISLYVVIWATRSFLEPRLVGRQLGLDPLVTLIALYSGYKLWGLVGMLLMPLLAASAFPLLPSEKKNEAG